MAAYGQASASFSLSSSPAAFTSGSGAKNAIIPKAIKAQMMIMNGLFRSSIPIRLTSFPSNHTIKIAGIGHANLLQIPIMLIRFAALSNGPRMVMYGFTDACRYALAAPLIKEASKNKGKLS